MSSDRTACWCGHSCGHPWAHDENPPRATSRRYEVNQDDAYWRNMRILRHEAETPMRNHDENGQCCIRAALTPLPDESD